MAAMICCGRERHPIVVARGEAQRVLMRYSLMARLHGSKHQTSTSSTVGTVKPLGSATGTRIQRILPEFWPPQPSSILCGCLRPSPLMILCIGATPALQRVMLFKSLKHGAVNRATQTLDSIAG